MAAILTPDAYYPPAEAARLREANRIVRQVQASLEHALSHPDEPPLHMPNCRCTTVPITWWEDEVSSYVGVDFGFTEPSVLDTISSCTLSPGQRRIVDIIQAANRGAKR